SPSDRAGRTLDDEGRTARRRARSLGAGDVAQAGVSRMGGRSRTVLWAWFSLAIWSATASLSEAGAAAPSASFQALNANAERIVEPLAMLGTPLPAPTRQALTTAEQACASQALEAALDRHCSFVVTLDPAGGVSLAQGKHGLF